MKYTSGRNYVHIRKISEFWLATRTGKMDSSYPLTNARFVPVQEKKKLHQADDLRTWAEVIIRVKLLWLQFPFWLSKRQSLLQSAFLLKITQSHNTINCCSCVQTISCISFIVPPFVCISQKTVKGASELDGAIQYSPLGEFSCESFISLQDKPGKYSSSPIRPNTKIDWRKVRMKQ